MLKLKNGYIDFIKGMSTCTLEYAVDTPKEACKILKNLTPALKIIVNNYKSTEFEINSIKDIFNAFNVTFNNRTVDYIWFKENE